MQITERVEKEKIGNEYLAYVKLKSMGKKNKKAQWNEYLKLQFTLE